MRKNNSLKTLRIVIEHFFTKIRVSKRIYQDVIDGLIETSLRGVDSHGIRLVPHYIRATLLGRINKNPKIKFNKTSFSVCNMDADHTYGISAGVIAMKKAISLAEKTGVGMVAVKNSSHFGAAGIYGLMAARKNMIGVAMTHVEDLVVPYGGTKPFLGTNAFCFAAPMDKEEPLCLDMATTMISFNKLRMYRRENKPLESGSAVDKAGNYTTDPHDAVALTHFGSYKGYGVALMIEVLCSLLTGGPYGPYITHMFPLSEKKRNLSHFFMAIDIKKFHPVIVFKKRMRQMAEEIRCQKPAQGFGAVMVAGDPEKNTYKERIKNGIPITDEMREDFNSLAKELNLQINI